MSTYLFPRAVCNFEVQTRNLSDDVATQQTVFIAVEEKLIRLGLNPAAHPGEVATSAVKLFESLRRRGLTAEDLLRRSAQAIWAARELSAARGYVVPFGKYRGKTVGELPPDYIRWVLRKCDNLSLNFKRAMQIVLKETSSKS